MNPYLEQLKQYLSTHEPNYGESDIHSLLELLCRWYTEWNPVDSDALRRHIQSLDFFFQKLSFSESNRVFMIISELCAQYEHDAYLEGLRVGLRLAAELQEL